jgi:transposase
MFLKVDACSPGWSDAQAGETFASARRTVFSVRQRFVEQGLEAALMRIPRERPSRDRLLDGDKQARLVQIAPAKSSGVGAVSRWTAPKRH